MKNTKPKIYLESACAKNLELRGRLEKVRSRLLENIDRMKRETEEISEALEIEYTGFLAMFKKTENSWECVRVINGVNIPDDIEDEWDLLVPIPKPESLPEFSGF